MPENEPMNALPSPTRAKLRSTQILTSLSQIISELVQNSLDASASRIEIGVDCEDWTCWVKDNGSGISKDDLGILGSDAEHARYATSKAYNFSSLDFVSTFGFRGEALASAAGLSCLEISSRTLSSWQTWSIIMKDGNCLYNGPATRWQRESPGTVVCIRDAFFNLPVRRLSHPSPSKTIDLVRQEIQAYALVFPNVTFSLENSRRGRDGNSTKSRILSVPKTQSTLAAFRNLFGRALSEHVDEVDHAWGEMKMEGFIALEGAHSKAYQFLYINRHPLSLCDLHRLIDNRFALSSFTKHALDETGDTELPRSSVRRSPRKHEKKPIYVLNLTIPPRYVDNCLEPRKSAVHLQNSDDVASFLSSVIQSFLIRHGFSRPSRPEPSQALDISSPSPRKRRKIMQDERDTSFQVKNDTHHSAYTFTSTNESMLDVHIHHDDTASDECEMTWIDPRTGEAFAVDKRTGNSYPRTRLTNEDDDRGESSRRRTLVNPGLGKEASITDDGAAENVPDWIRIALEANKTYSLTEQTIPSLPLASTFSRNISQSKSSQHSCHDTASRSRFFAPGQPNLDPTGFLRRFRKEELRNAHVVSQVDRKFVACLLDGKNNDGADGNGNDRDASNRTLVLIDQHAADERVRVEQYLKELCHGFMQGIMKGVRGVQTKTLTPPVPVLLTYHEAKQLAGSDEIQHAFKSWGIEFVNIGVTRCCRNEADAGSGDEQYVQILVGCVPDVVSDKLTASGELRDLVKGFLAKIEMDGLDSYGIIIENSDDTQPLWLKAARWCPRELLDLINSKACRGAIMFNDSLTQEQCERLVRQLAETVFPFQCAHGRPSLVPLANFGDGSGFARRQPNVEWSKLQLQDYN